jgi:HAD superfamily hydrolase (TIGR01509 family)
MDGVLVDSNPFHLEKWAAFLKARGIAFDPDELPKRILGQRNDVLFRSYFGADLSDAEAERLGAEIEAEFRRDFEAHAKPMPGLVELIAESRRAGIPTAVASSAIMENVSFVVRVLGLQGQFKCLVSGEDVRHPKPDPEIYLEAAKRLGVGPQDCVGFEDSFVGINSVCNAEMMCVAIASTFEARELRDTCAELVVPDFRPLSLERLQGLFRERSTDRGAPSYPAD